MKWEHHIGCYDNEGNPTNDHAIYHIVFVSNYCPFFRRNPILDSKVDCPLSCERMDCGDKVRLYPHIH